MSAAIVLVGAAAPGTATAQRWSIQPAAIPPGTNPFTVLRGVSCTSASSCTAVGGYFASGSGMSTLAEHWDGTNWTIQASPNATDATDSELMAVSCASASACVGVGFSDILGGSGNAPLAEHWDGSSWTLDSVALPAGASSGGYLEGVSCAGATDCIAVGGYNDATGSYNAFAEHWDGTSWELQNAVSPPGSSELHGVSCSSSTTCTAVGYVGGANTGGASLALAERWNGLGWTAQNAPSPTGLDHTELFGASCPSDTACTAAGYYTSGFSVVGTPLAERWDGSGWSVEPTPTLHSLARLNGVSCATANSCTAVGTDTDALAEAWNGTSWRLQHVPDPQGAIHAELNGVSCPTANDCAAVGDWYSNAYVDQPLIELYS